MPDFKLVTDFVPQGDQPEAIAKLTEGLLGGRRDQVLLGVTGSGKTFTMANVIATVQRPTLVIAPNKTLAAQLYSEFKDLFPENAVEYFVSYYDYYQPDRNNKPPEGSLLPVSVYVYMVCSTLSVLLFTKHPFSTPLFSAVVSSSYRKSIGLVTSMSPCTR